MSIRMLVCVEAGEKVNKLDMSILQFRLKKQTKKCWVEGWQLGWKGGDSCK